LQMIVRDARLLLEALKGTTLVDDEVVKAAALLSDILNQDITGGCEVPAEASARDADGGDQLVEIKQGVAKDRTVSTVDTEMRHGRKHASKRFDGYKVHIGEDLATELITDIEVTPGNVHDSEPVEAMLTASAEKLGAYPGELLGDTHYGTADLRVALQEHGIEVVAKVAGGNRKDRFSKVDFTIDLDQGEVTCPAGHTTSHHHQMRDAKGRKTRCYLFGAALCGACSLRKNCTTSANGRSIRLHYHERTLAAARRYNASEAFKTKYRRRALVERKLSELLWRHDLRHGRYMGQAKMRLQALWTAAVVNLKRLFKLLGALPYPLGADSNPPRALFRVAT
jgi:DDE family transposase